MKTIEQEELYKHLSGFLKTKGIELKAGSYAQGIQKSCNLLSDAINLGHAGFERAKVKIDEKLEQMRQVIHEKTAPRPPVNPPPGATAAAPAAPPTPKAAPRKRPARKQTARRKPGRA